MASEIEGKPLERRRVAGEEALDRSDSAIEDGR
jgi:hypothetical protein